MGIRIQPREVVIPVDDPFKNDLLDRKEKAEVLTSLVSNVDGPCAMAVDAAWGAGKTTFLKMWAQNLRNQGFPVVEFNAWETDSSGDPFVALTSEITQQLKGVADTSKLDQIETHAKELLSRLAPGLIRFGTGFIPVVGPEVGHALSTYAEEAMSGYNQTKQSTAQFKTSLQGLAEALWETRDHKPVVIFIDELDRCRPSYAIELLETAKHIFGVDHVVFVLAVNRAELAHSACGLYGEKFDAEGYLRRFFDIDFRLPAPDRKVFIHNMLESVGVNKFFAGTSDRTAKDYSALISETLALFLGQSNLSLRSVGQTIHRFGLVLSSLTSHERTYLRTLTVLAIFRAIDLSVYRRFIDGETTAEQAINYLFGLTNYAGLRYTESGLLVQAVIIAASVNPSIVRMRPDDMQRDAPLLSSYRQILDEYEAGNTVNQLERRTAEQIVTLVGGFHGPNLTPDKLLGYDESVSRLELLSPDLTETE